MKSVTPNFVLNISYNENYWTLQMIYRLAKLTYPTKWLINKIRMMRKIFFH